MPIEMYLPYQQIIYLSGLCHREQTRRRNANEEARANPARIKTAEQGTLPLISAVSRGVKEGRQVPRRHVADPEGVGTLIVSLSVFANSVSYGLFAEESHGSKSAWFGRDAPSPWSARVLFQNRSRASGGGRRPGGPWQQQ